MNVLRTIVLVLGFMMQILFRAASAIWGWGGVSDASGSNALVTTLPFGTLSARC